MLSRILKALVTLWKDERGFAGAAALGGLAGAAGGGGGGLLGGASQLLGTLFNIGSQVTGLFQGPEAEFQNELLNVVKGARRRNRGLQSMVGPLNNLLFQSLGTSFGLQPNIDPAAVGVDVGRLLGLPGAVAQIPGTEEFVDVSQSKKTAKDLDKLAKLESRVGLKRAKGRGAANIRRKQAKIRERIDERGVGVGIPEDLDQQLNELLAGIRDPFDISQAAEQSGLGLQQQAIQRQIEESVPPGGLREKLLSDAASQFGIQRGLLESQDDLRRLNFMLGLPSIVQSEFGTAIGAGASGARTEALNDMNALQGLMGSGQALAGGFSGLDDFLSQFGGGATDVSPLAPQRPSGGGFFTPVGSQGVFRIA